MTQKWWLRSPQLQKCRDDWMDLNWIKVEDHNHLNHILVISLLYGKLESQLQSSQFKILTTNAWKKNWSSKCNLVLFCWLIVKSCKQMIQPISNFKQVEVIWLNHIKTNDNKVLFQKSKRLLHDLITLVKDFFKKVLKEHFCLVLCHSNWFPLPRV